MIMGLYDKLMSNKSKKPSEKMYLYSEQELVEYEAYIEQSFGAYQTVFHEIASPDIHLDVLVVPPTEEDPYIKLITMGMGAYGMNVPKEFAKHELEHAELIIYLPPDWNIQSSDDRDYWPIRYLKKLGRLPIECDTWLGFGHTVHVNADMKPFSENTSFNSFVLLKGCDLQYNELNLRLNSEKKINFYQLFPLYQEELDYMLDNSLNALFEMFDDEDVNPVININRRNYCK